MPISLQILELGVWITQTKEMSVLKCLALVQELKPPCLNVYAHISLDLMFSRRLKIIVDIAGCN